MGYSALLTISLLVFGAGAILTCYCGFRYMTQLTTGRRAALMATAGIVMTFSGLAYAYQAEPPPKELAQVPVERNISCDGALRHQVESIPGPYRSGTVQTLIQRVQRSRPGCAAPTWNPRPITAPDSGRCGEAMLPDKERVGGMRATEDLQHTTGGGMIYLGTHWQVMPETAHGVTAQSGKTSRGNALIHWEYNHRPHDGANCWLYHRGELRWSAE